MKKSILVWMVLGLLGLAVFIFYFNHAFPLASVQINTDKELALQVSSRFIKDEGFDFRGFDDTVIFDSDYDASSYLQKTQGIKKTNFYIKQGIPVWFWRVKFFKELKKDGFTVNIDPSSGRIVYFKRHILEDEPLNSISYEEALAKASSKARFLGVDLSGYELKDKTVKKQKNRVDYEFAWDKKGLKIQDAVLRVEVDIYGDTLGKYKKYLKVPETFLRELDGEIYFGRMLAMIATVVKFLFTAAAVFFIIFTGSRIKVNWKLWFAVGCGVAFLKIANSLNTLPFLWSFYNDTMAKGVFIMDSLGDEVVRALTTAAMVVAYGVLAEIFLPVFKGKKPDLYRQVRESSLKAGNVFPLMAVGYSAGFIFLGYITLFYLLGSRFLGIWIPPETEYSNIFAVVIPFFLPLTLALNAAVYEEVTYRFFAIAFMKKVFKITFLALLLPALTWGFAHSFYRIFPTYVRGIELTLFGIFLGIIFLKYGLETVVIAHFTANCVLIGLPLLKSHNLCFALSGVFAVFSAALPFFVLVIFRKKLRINDG